jgi:hypothetical protein
MPDARHWWDSDIAISSTGDLALSDGIDLSNQRIVRRLMTILGEYVWHTDYGASVPVRVGDTLDLSLIESIVRGQIFEEAAVDPEYDPEIIVTKILNGVFVAIRYVDALTGQQASLDFDVEL